MSELEDSLSPRSQNDEKPVLPVKKRSSGVNKHLRPLTPPNRDRSADEEANEKIVQRPSTASTNRPAKKSAKSSAAEKKPHKTKFVKEFQTALDKINTNETRELGMREVQKIILGHQSTKYLRVYLSSLCNPNQRQGLNSSTKEMIVLLMGYLASIYKTNLLDPIDQPPDLIKTVMRVSEAIQSHFNDEGPSVQQACARSLCELYTSSLAETENRQVSLILIEPLISILNGGADRATQHTAAVCLCEFLHLAIKKGVRELILMNCERIYQLYLKTNHEYVELIRSVGICLGVGRAQGLSERVFQLVNRLCTSIGRNQTNANIGNQNKVESCNVIAIIAKILIKEGSGMPGELALIYDRVEGILRDLSKNKIYKIQQAASETLKAWEEMKSCEPQSAKRDKTQQQQEKEEESPVIAPIKKPELVMPTALGGFKNYKAVRDEIKKAKQQEQGSEEDDNSILQNKELSLMSKDIEKYVDKAVVGLNKAQDFTKAHSGNGGGYVGWSAPAGEQRQSYEMQKRHLKDLILGKKALQPEVIAEKSATKKRTRSKGSTDSKDPKVKSKRRESSNEPVVTFTERPRSRAKRYTDPDANEGNCFEGIKITTQNNGLIPEGFKPQKESEKVQVNLDHRRQLIQAFQHPPKLVQHKAATRYQQDVEEQVVEAEEHQEHHPHSHHMEIQTNLKNLSTEPRILYIEDIYDKNNFPQKGAHGSANKSRSENENSISDVDSLENGHNGLNQDPNKDINTVRPPQSQQMSWFVLSQPQTPQVSNANQNSAGHGRKTTSKGDNLHLLNYKSESQVQPEDSQSKKPELQKNSTIKSSYSARRLNEIIHQGRQQSPSYLAREKAKEAESLSYMRKGRLQGAIALDDSSEDSGREEPPQQRQPRKVGIHPPMLLGNQELPSDPRTYHIPGAANHNDSLTSKRRGSSTVRFADEVSHDEQQPHQRIDEYPQEQQDYFMPAIKKYNDGRATGVPSLHINPNDDRAIAPMNRENYQKLYAERPVPLDEQWDGSSPTKKIKEKRAVNSSNLQDTILWDTMNSAELRERFGEPADGSQAQSHTPKSYIKPSQVLPAPIKSYIRPPARAIANPKPKASRSVSREDISTLDKWKLILEKANREDLDGAYRDVLATGDDIYLLRLLNITGPCLKKLQQKTAVDLMKRILKLNRSSFAEKLSLSFLESSHENGVIYGMNVPQQRSLLDVLFKMTSSSNAVGKMSAGLYAKLQNLPVDLAH